MHVLATVNVYLGPHHVVITGKQAEKTFTERQQRRTPPAGVHILHV